MHFFVQIQINPRVTPFLQLFICGFTVFVCINFQVNLISGFFQFQRYEITFHRLIKFFVDKTDLIKTSLKRNNFDKVILVDYFDTTDYLDI